MPKATAPIPRKRSWFPVFGGLLVIAALIAMPFVAWEPGDGEIPRWAMFAGRFHPAILHLPIGVFALILLQEIGLMFRRGRPDSLFPLFFGTATAILAVIAGFLLYRGGGYEGNSLAERHLWGGLAFAVMAVVTFVAKVWAVADLARPAIYRTLLFGSVAVMGFASHDGASITHGSGYLTYYAPQPLKKILGIEVKPSPGPVPSTARTTADLAVYADLVAPALERTCVHCHKEGKAKGRLRMDTYDLLLKGGKEGPGIEIGDADGSNIIYRIELEEDDDEHMPPEGKPDLTSDELAILKWWINSGADPEKTVRDLEVTDEVAAPIERVGKARLNSAARP